MKPKSTPIVVVVLLALIASTAAPALSASWDFGSTRAKGHAPVAGNAVSLDGVNDYLTFGQATSTLGAQSFTLELWFYWVGGVTTSTGTGGVTAIPLLTKGRGEADGSDLDMNYFMGLTTAGQLTADFEDFATGGNHPVTGATKAAKNTWNHAAATYDSVTGQWTLYLNGIVDGSTSVASNRTPRYDSRQHAGLGTAMTSTGAAAGFFQGLLDEARVWNVVRTQQEIRDNLGLEISSGTGLLGRWGLNDGSGLTALNSIAGSPNGTLTNGPLWVNGTTFTTPDALGFFGTAATDAYVTFGDPAALDLGQFTLETWFKREAAGVAASTGTGGVSAVPLITKGRGEAEGSNVDMNYFLGIRSSDGVLAADFEEGATGASPGLNHPVVGVTPIQNNTWYHAAVTYDGTTWRLYLNGNLENELVAGQPPRGDSIQRAALASALNSTGVPEGYFYGVMDEVRIWSYARTQAQIQASINAKITGPQAGLAARWSLDDGAGRIVADSAGAAVSGTVTGDDFGWVSGAPFDMSFTPPSAPSGLAAAATSAFRIDLGWTDTSTNEAAFEVERCTGAGCGSFSLLATLGANIATYADDSVQSLTTYCYRVRATNAGGSSAYTDPPACATTPAEGVFALDLAPTSYVTFGDDPATDLAQFTVETWFRRDATGTPNTTGSGGIANAIPLISNGAPEADNSNVDMNYVLCIDNDQSVLCADFEEGAAGSSPGLNHPINGETPIVAGQWYHAAVTYDGTSWALYLNGNLEAEAYVGQPVRGDNISPTALATMLTSGSVTRGFFDGALDEVRIWNYARSQSDILATINTQITAPEPGLVARWGLNEGAGVAIHGTAGTGVHGAIIGSSYAWATPGAPFNVTIPAPAAPSFLRAAAGSSDQIALSWQDNANSETGFQIERSTDGGSSFSSLATTSANVTGYIDQGLATSTPYCYRVYATNSTGSSALSNTVCATTLAGPAYALDFGPDSAYVTFGDAAALKLSQFTLETWFRREGSGSTANTGTGGLYGIPLVTKGVGEAEGSNVDMNYFLGIRGSDNVLCADFEEGAGGASPGQNHPVCGTTAIKTHLWYHAAATYDGSTWKLYLNGDLEATLAVGQPVRSDSIQHAGLGVALNSTGVGSGHFDGVLDEVRIWNHARSQDLIQSTINQEITSPQAGLVGRWSLGEGSGMTVAGSAGTTTNGTIANAGYAWVGGAPFGIVNVAPAAPAVVQPTDGAIDVTVPVLLGTTVTDPNGDAMAVTFYGRPAQTASPDFTVVVLPDTQYYSKNYPATFTAQTSWIVTNQAARNIVFVTHLGDIVDSGDGPSADVEWTNAANALYLLETGGADVPYGLGIGNHDQATAGDPDSATNHYNTSFGVAHFTGRPYYGGHYGANNDDHYELFSSGGLDFIIIHIEATENAGNATFLGALAWADGLLQANAERRGIVVFHNLFSLGSSSQFSSAGQALFNQLKDNPNLFLLMGGHVPGVNRRVDTGTDGHTIYSLLADYQGEPNGGNGWLRIMTFSPANNQIQVTTYSPTLQQYKTDSGNQFTLDYPMAGSGFQAIGTVPAGLTESSAQVTWQGLAYNRQYEWYVSVTDGQKTSRGPVWSFTTEVSPLAVTLASFEATSQANHVLVAWETESEINNRGFNLYRATTPAGPEQQLNATLIPSQSPGSSQGFAYAWQDYDVIAGTTYYYWLESVSTSGATRLYGPVSTTYQGPTAITLTSLNAASAGKGFQAGRLLPVALLFATALILWLRRA